MFFKKKKIYIFGCQSLKKNFQRVGSVLNQSVQRMYKNILSLQLMPVKRELFFLPYYTFFTEKKTEKCINILKTIILYRLLVN